MHCKLQVLCTTRCAHRPSAVSCTASCTRCALCAVRYALRALHTGHQRYAKMKVSAIYIESAIYVIYSKLYAKMKVSAIYVVSALYIIYSKPYAKMKVSAKYVGSAIIYIRLTTLYKAQSADFHLGIALAIYYI